jgi:hypothetical protein
MGLTRARTISFVALEGAPGVRGLAGHIGRQQPWPHPAPTLHRGGQAEAGGGRGRAWPKSILDLQLLSGKTIHKYCVVALYKD